MYQISYSREEGTDLYRVYCPAFNQTIVRSRHLLVKWIGMDPRTIVGCKDVSQYAIIELGFVAPQPMMIGGLYNVG